MGLLRVGHDWASSLSLFAFMHWRRKWQPTPVFLPGESQGRGSLVGCRLWGHTESDMTEATKQQQQQQQWAVLLAFIWWVMKEEWVETKVKTTHKTHSHIQINIVHKWPADFKQNRASISYYFYKPLFSFNTFSLKLCWFLGNIHLACHNKEKYSYFLNYVLPSNNAK